jgi:acyl carrier protein
MWEAENAMAAEPGGGAPVSRGGLIPIATGQGLELFERARAAADPLAIVAPFEESAMRTQARAGILPPLFSGLVRVSARRARTGGASLARRLQGVAEPERREIVLGLVREHVAAILGHSSPGTIEATTPFADQGLDSVAAVELRNRLTRATDLRLEATLVFDHPNPEAVAGYLLEQVGGEAAARSAIQQQFEGLEALLGTAEAAEHREISARLRSLNARAQQLMHESGEVGESTDGVAEEEGLESVSDDELLELIDQEFGEPA